MEEFMMVMALGEKLSLNFIMVCTVCFVSNRVNGIFGCFFFFFFS